MKRGALIIPAFLLLTLLAACSQDAIFYNISTESKPIDARIKGGPTNMVVFERNGKPLMYVASGSSLHWYTADSWDKSEYDVSDPGGTISGLAVTANYLYAVTSSGLKRLGKTGKDWQEIDKSSSLTSVYAAGNRVFIGKKTSGQADASGAYTISYLDDGGTGITLTALNLNGPGKLTGAAGSGSTYYVSTDKGVFAQSGGPLSNNTGVFMGMISLGSQIIAIARDKGQLYAVSGSSLTARANMDKAATGALCAWRSSASGAPQLLLAGKQDSSYSYGYREFLLDGGGNPGAAHDPGKNTVSSVVDNSRYASSIGTRPVNHLFQVPSSVDSKMVLFASTAKDGLWSYRTRNGTPEWNAEE
jgi:hypothetical protein